jgi:hypothetical protein
VRFTVGEWRGVGAFRLLAGFVTHRSRVQAPPAPRNIPVCLDLALSGRVRVGSVRFPHRARKMFGRARFVWVVLLGSAEQGGAGRPSHTVGAPGTNRVVERADITPPLPSGPLRPDADSTRHTLEDGVLGNANSEFASLRTVRTQERGFSRLQLRSRRAVATGVFLTSTDEVIAVAVLVLTMLLSIVNHAGAPRSA